MGREMGGRCQRKGTCVYLWLIRVEVVSQHSWDKVPLPKRGSQSRPFISWPLACLFPSPRSLAHSLPAIHVGHKSPAGIPFPLRCPHFPPCLDPNRTLSLEKAAHKCARALTHRGLCSQMGRDSRKSGIQGSEQGSEQVETGSESLPPTSLCSQPGSKTSSHLLTLLGPQRADALGRTPGGCLVDSEASNRSRS